MNKIHLKIFIYSKYFKNMISLIKAGDKYVLCRNRKRSIKFRNDCI